MVCSLNLSYALYLLHFHCQLLCGYYFADSGPLLAFPVQNVSVSLTSLTLGSTTPLPFLSSCVAEGVAKALREADVQVSQVVEVAILQIRRCTHVRIHTVA